MMITNNEEGAHDGTGPVLFWRNLRALINNTQLIQMLHNNNDVNNSSNKHNDNTTNMIITTHYYYYYDY